MGAEGAGDEKVLFGDTAGCEEVDRKAESRVFTALQFMAYRRQQGGRGNPQANKSGHPTTPRPHPAHQTATQLDPFGSRAWSSCDASSSAFDDKCSRTNSITSRRSQIVDQTERSTKPSEYNGSCYYGVVYSAEDAVAEG